MFIMEMQEQPVINTSNGTIVWKNSDFKCKFVQGPASSPVLYKNLVILHYEGVDVRFLVALDKSTGKLVWKSDRPAEPYKPLTEIGRKAYTTPLIINVKGRDLLISNGSAVCIAYDPTTGKEIWRVVDGAESTIAMPITENGMVYWYTGFMVAGDGQIIQISWQSIPTARVILQQQIYCGKNGMNWLITRCLPLSSGMD